MSFRDVTEALRPIIREALWQAFGDTYVHNILPRIDKYNTWRESKRVRHGMVKPGKQRFKKAERKFILDETFPILENNKWWGKLRYRREVSDYLKTKKRKPRNPVQIIGYDINLVKKHGFVETLKRYNLKPLALSVAVKKSPAWQKVFNFIAPSAPIKSIILVNKKVIFLRHKLNLRSFLGVLNSRKEILDQHGPKREKSEGLSPAEIFNYIHYEKGNFKIIPRIQFINFNNQLSFTFQIGYIEWRPIYKTYTFFKIPDELAAPLSYYEVAIYKRAMAFLIRGLVKFIRSLIKWPLQLSSFATVLIAVSGLRYKWFIRNSRFFSTCKRLMLVTMAGSRPFLFVGRPYIKSLYSVTHIYRTLKEFLKKVGHSIYAFLINQIYAGINCLYLYIFLIPFCTLDENELKYFAIAPFIIIRAKLKNYVYWLSAGRKANIHTLKIVLKLGLVTSIVTLLYFHIMISHKIIKTEHDYSVLAWSLVLVLLISCYTIFPNFRKELQLWHAEIISLLFFVFFFRVVSLSVHRTSLSPIMPLTQDGRFPLASMPDMTYYGNTFIIFLLILGLVMVVYSNLSEKNLLETHIYSTHTDLKDRKYKFYRNFYKYLYFTEEDMWSLDHGKKFLEDSSIPGFLQESTFNYWSPLNNRYKYVNDEEEGYTEQMLKIIELQKKTRKYYREIRKEKIWESLGRKYTREIKQHPSESFEMNMIFDWLETDDMYADLMETTYDDYTLQLYYEMKRERRKFIMLKKDKNYFDRYRILFNDWDYIEDEEIPIFNDYPEATLDDLNHQLPQECLTEVLTVPLLMRALKPHIKKNYIHKEVRASFEPPEDFLMDLYKIARRRWTSLSIYILELEEKVESYGARNPDELSMSEICTEVSNYLSIKESFRHNFVMSKNGKSGIVDVSHYIELFNSDIVSEWVECFEDEIEELMDFRYDFPIPKKLKFRRAEFRDITHLRPGDLEINPMELYNKLNETMFAKRGLNDNLSLRRYLKYRKRNREIYEAMNKR